MKLIIASLLIATSPIKNAPPVMDPTKPVVAQIASAIGLWLTPSQLMNIESFDVAEEVCRTHSDDSIVWISALGNWKHVRCADIREVMPSRFPKSEVPEEKK